MAYHLIICVLTLNLSSLCYEMFMPRNCAMELINDKANEQCDRGKDFERAAQERRIPNSANSIDFNGFAVSVQTHSVPSENSICDDHKNVTRAVAMEVFRHKSGNVMLFTPPAICDVFPNWKIVLTLYLRSGAQNRKIVFIIQP